MDFSRPLSHSLTPRRSQLVPLLLLGLGLIVALSAALYGYLESRRTEPVLIALRTIPFGQQIVADDLATVELPLHRPAQLVGIRNAEIAVGQYAARTIGPNDLVQPSMLLSEPPTQPVYPNGEQLHPDMVPLPFSTETIGPLNEHDLVNIGFNDAEGDPALCQHTGGTAITPPTTVSEGGTEVGRPYACRLLERVRVLYVDSEQGVAFLELTPAQAHAIWALRAAETQGILLWGERYGTTSAPLAVLDRLDASQLTPEQITGPLSPTLQLTPEQSTGPLSPTLQLEGGR